MKKIAIRVDERTIEIIDEVADELQLSRSEVIRFFLDKAVYKDKKNLFERLNNESRKELIEQFMKLSTDINYLKKDYSSIANNVNQIAKKINTSGIDDESKKMFYSKIEEIKKMLEYESVFFDFSAKGMSAFWELFK